MKIVIAQTLPVNPTRSCKHSFPRSKRKQHTVLTNLSSHHLALTFVPHNVNLGSPLTSQERWRFSGNRVWVSLPSHLSLPASAPHILKQGHARKSELFSSHRSAAPRNGCCLSQMPHSGGWAFSVRYQYRMLKQSFPFWSHLCKNSTHYREIWKKICWLHDLKQITESPIFFICKMGIIITQTVEKWMK